MWPGSGRRIMETSTAPAPHVNAIHGTHLTPDLDLRVIDLTRYAEFEAYCERRDSHIA
jgi:hypothetical protein